MRPALLERVALPSEAGLLFSVKFRTGRSTWQAFQLLQQSFYELGSWLCFSPGASVEVSDLSNFVVFAI